MMPYQRKPTLLFLATTLSLSFGNIGSATDGNWSIQKEFNLENQPKSKEGIVYLKTNSLAEPNWLSQMSLIRTTQSSTINKGSAESQRVRRPEMERHRLEPRTDDLSQVSLPRTNVFTSLSHPSVFHKHKDTPNERLEKLSPQKRPSDVEDGYQSDNAGHMEKVADEKIYDPTTRIVQDWLDMRLSVYCSGAAMTLTAKGRGYTSLLVDRVDASPLSVLHLPSYCGFFVRATWKDLTLMVPYDGCYILHENGTHVLPLLWWARPIKVSCPVTPASSPASLPGFCSYFGMVIEMKGIRRAMKKAMVRVNGEWVPLVSDKCAYCMGLPPEEFLIISFTALCVMDGSYLTVLLDGRVFTLTCRPPLPPFPLPLHVPSSRLSPPLDVGHTHIKNTLLEPSPTESEASKTDMVPFWPPFRPGFVPMTYQTTNPIDPHIGDSVPYANIDPSRSLVLPVLSGGAQSTPMQHPHPSMPLYYIPQVHYVPAPISESTTTTTVATTTPMTTTAASTTTATTSKAEAIIPPFHPPVGHYPARGHMVYPPHHHIPHFTGPYPFPYYYPLYHQAPLPPIQPTREYTAQRISIPKQTPEHQITRPSSPLPQFPHDPGLLVLPVASPKMSPSSLSCAKDHFTIVLPSAKMESIKVKDVKRNMWVSVISAPASCGYSLQREDKEVVLFSPLPACHMRTLSSSQLSLSLKFWDPTLLRHRTLQLQCPYTSPPGTTDPPALWTRPATSLKPKPIATSPQPSNFRDKPFKPQMPPLSEEALAPPPLSEEALAPPPLSEEALAPPPLSEEALAPPPLSEKPLVSPVYPPKPTVQSFQPSKHIFPTSWPSELSLLPEITSLPSQTDIPQVRCYSQNMSVTLPSWSITGLTVHTPYSNIKQEIKPVALDKPPGHCGYKVEEDQNGYINILLPYTSCHMAHQDGHYRVLLKYQSTDGHTAEALLSCQVSTSKECSLPIEQRLPCGFSSISAVECHELDCCYSSDTALCYYPMDECTADRHFVFSVPASLTDPPLSPAFLVAAGNASCTPQKVVGDSALFKIPLDGCGVHRYEVGYSVIYMLEILNTPQSLSLNYGTISRDSPFRLLVECRYLPGSMASVGYLVKSPALFPSIQAQGVFGVQLRIAKDQQYSTYYPQYHRPLRKLLGKPLYLEVRLLNPPDPTMVLLVHYCVAYPRSAHSAWIIIYDGCPNPLDLTATHTPPLPPQVELANQVKRFTVSTFQFQKSSSVQSEHEGLEKKEEEEVNIPTDTERAPLEHCCVSLQSASDLRG